MNNLNEQAIAAELKEEVDPAVVSAKPAVEENDLYPGSFFRIPAPPTPNTAWRLA